MNVKTVLARREVLDVRDHLHVVSHFREGDCASDVTAGLRLELSDGFRGILRLREGGESAQHY